MAIERTEKGRTWEIKATGKDVHSLKGMLNEYGAQKFQESWVKGQKKGFEKITDPAGNQTWIPGDQIAEYRAQGYGQVVSPSFVVPELPWQKNHKPNPGKHRYKYDPVSQDMVEV
jgi:hypothetical protein